MSEFGLSAQDINQIRLVFQRFPKIQQALIYGSRVKGNFRASSDIDLTLIGDIDWPLFNRIESELDDLMLPYKIDLSLFS